LLIVLFISTTTFTFLRLYLLLILKFFELLSLHDIMNHLQLFMMSQALNDVSNICSFQSSHDFSCVSLTCWLIKWPTIKYGLSCWTLINDFNTVIHNFSMTPFDELFFSELSSTVTTYVKWCFVKTILVYTTRILTFTQTA